MRGGRMEMMEEGGEMEMEMEMVEGWWPTVPMSVSANASQCQCPVSPDSRGAATPDQFCLPRVLSYSQLEAEKR